MILMNDPIIVIYPLSLSSSSWMFRLLYLFLCFPRQNQRIQVEISCLFYVVIPNYKIIISMLHPVPVLERLPCDNSMLLLRKFCAVSCVIIWLGTWCGWSEFITKYCLVVWSVVLGRWNIFSELLSCNELCFEWHAFSLRRYSYTLQSYYRTDKNLAMI
jgi:hypothetical protein